MRIVIHGGMHKTGTKSLQYLLAGNCQPLAAAGICYPENADVHHERHLNAKEADWDPRRCIEVVRQAERAGFYTVILSSEAVSTFSTEQFRKLAACFAGHSLKYVFCFRHWSGFLPSRWAQNSRRDTQTFDAYTRTVTTPASRHIDLRYDLVLAHASRCEGCDIAAVSFDNAVAKHNSVVPCLLEAIEIPRHLIDALTPQERKLNQRRDWVLVEIGRLLNGILADRWKMPQDERCRSLGEHRRCDAFFDLHDRIVALDPAMINSLSDIVVRNSTRRTADVNDVAVLNALAENYGHCFTNLIDGRIFAETRSESFMTTDLVWQDFRDLAGPVTMEVIARWERDDAALRHFARAGH